MATATRRKLIITSSSADGVATFNITGEIGYADSATSAVVATMVDGFISAGITSVKVYLNTPGGNCFEANEIINHLKKFKDVKIFAGAMIASAGTLFAALFHTTVKSNTRFMIHKPSMGYGGNEDQIESDLKLLKDLTSEYRTAYATKTGKTEDEIEKMWAKGDVWLNAKEALEQKFVDALDAQEEKLTPEDIAVIYASSCPNKPPIKSQTMDKDKIISLLGLPADATDDQIFQAMEDAKKKADQYDAAQGTAEEDETQKAEAMVNKAITDKKIKADQKSVWLGMAKADFDSAKKAIDGLVAVKPLSEQYNPGKGKEVEAHKTWTLDDYLEKDTEALAKLATENPSRYKELEDNYFKTK